MPTSRGTHTSSALVLAGAVAKGAFEAGAAKALAEVGMEFRQFVGTSAGALNATILAAGAACGRFRAAASVVERLWIDRGSLWNFLRPTFALRQGLSTTRAVEALVYESLESIVGDGPDHRLAATRDAADRVSLTLVTTALDGELYMGQVTHEDEHVFDAAALRSKAARKRIARVAAASAAFPGLFVPPTLDDGRQRVDGGAVNNTPISYAIDESAAHNRIVVVSAEANPIPSWPMAFRGMALVGQLASVIINERIARDLVVAEKRNTTLAELEHAMADLPEEQRDAIIDTLGWRHLDLLVIRPEEALEGTPFSAFFSRRLREAYVRSGSVAAKRVLAAESTPASWPKLGDVWRAPSGRPSEHRKTQ